MKALGRRMVSEGGPDVESRIRHGFRLCLTRMPRPEELRRLAGLYQETYSRYLKDPAGAAPMATDPIGPLPRGAQAPEMAAWTVVGNVLLNLDEMFSKR